jgi:hypothetical protein
MNPFPCTSRYRHESHHPRLTRFGRHRMTVFSYELTRANRWASTHLGVNAGQGASGTRTRWELATLEKWTPGPGGIVKSLPLIPPCEFLSELRLVEFPLGPTMARRIGSLSPPTRSAPYVAFLLEEPGSGNGNPDTLGLPHPYPVLPGYRKGGARRPSTSSPPTSSPQLT